MTHDHDPKDTAPAEDVDAVDAGTDSDPGTDSDSGADADGDVRVVDESAWAEGEDGDDDDDDASHFGHVAGEAHEAAAAAAAATEVQGRAEVQIVLAADAEIPLAAIDEDALWVVKRLRAKGFEAYLTGGCVRDLLLGRTPKDFDVATAAHPNQVRAVFRNCRLVGRRFRLAHVFFPSGKVIETATFRANPTDTLEDLPEDLLVARDNVFGTVEEDARRRDLTINGLFYDPVAGKVLDFVNGRADLDARLIRTIGDPDIRFQEDPVRILRAVKFATRLGFNVEETTWAAMCRHVGGLVRCAPARLQEELLRLLTSGHAAASWDLCAKAGVTQVMLPELYEAMETALEGRTVTTTTTVTVPAPEMSTETPAETPAETSTETPAETEPTEPQTTTAPTTTTVTTTTTLSPLTPDERRARLTATLASLDAIRQREADITSAVAFAALLAPVFEAFQASTTSFETWWATTSERFIERLRLTRHDKERVPQLFAAQLEMAPEKRRGHHARSVVVRPSFREALLLMILRKHAANESFEEIGLWKAIARAHGANYSLPRLDKNRMRAAGKSGDGGGDRRRGRDRDRGGRGGGGGGGRDRGRGRGRR
jgi:tRNA nucleotidyltransferase/poly(A) polymerase